MEMVILGLSSVLFLISGILILRILKTVDPLWPWILVIISFFLISSLFGYQVYLLISSGEIYGNVEIIDLLSLLSAILALVGAFYISQQVISIQSERRNASDKLSQFRQLMDKDPNMILFKDCQGSYLMVNAAYAKYLGKEGESLIGKSDFDFLPRSQANSFRQEEEKVIEAGNSSSRVEEIHGVAGIRSFLITRTPVKDANEEIIGLLVSGHDVTSQKNSEISLGEYRNDLAILSEADLALTNVTDIPIFYENFLNWASKLAGTDHAGLYSVEGKGPRLLVKAATGRLGEIDNLSLKAGEDVPGKVWQTGQSMVINDYQNWPYRARPMQNSGFTAAIGLPLKVNNQVKSVIGLYKDKSGEGFQSDKVEILELFAQIASSYLQNLERIAGYHAEREDYSQTAARIQYRLRLEHLVAVIATHFIVISAEKIDEAIERSLQTVGKVLGVDFAYLVIFPKEGVQETLLAAYFTGKDPPRDPSRDLNADEFQGFLGRLNQLETVHIASVSDLPIDSEEAAFLKSRGIKAYTAIPLVFNRSMIGYLGFEVSSQELEWSPEILALLKICAEMFVNTMERKSTATELLKAKERIQYQIEFLEQQNKENALIAEMGDLLQACRTADEAYPIIARYVQRLIPVGSGALYLIHDSDDPAEDVISWGSTPPGATEHEVVLNDCWGLRRGRLYVVQDVHTEPVCGHIKEPFPNSYICVPLMAQGYAVGLLHLRVESAAGEVITFSESVQSMAMKIAEYISMTLTNLRLRDNLRSQAIRDPLTGLFNRRYMEETLEREIRRGIRHNTSVGVIMFDLDKMKPINDRFGHDAGDVVLKVLGSELIKTFRGEDVACRYGGDEFTIVLPEASLADVWRRAEQMRESIKRMNLQYEGKSLGPITLSVGVSAYPDHGNNAERVLLACDAALYAAKSEGGDRIMMGRTPES